MARDIKFYLDENVHRFNALAKALRRRGIDVETVLDANLRTAPDETQFSYAQSQGRVIYTHDDDLLVIASTCDHAGIVFSSAGRHPMGTIIQRIELIWEVLDMTEMRNNIEYL